MSPLRRVIAIATASLMTSLTLAATPSSAAANVLPVPYSGSIGTNVGGTAGGVLKRGNTYYMMSVGHVVGPLYTQIFSSSDSPGGSYGVGGVAYNAKLGPTGNDDIALIELGTARPNPRIRVCGKPSCPTPPGYTVPQIATIDSVPAGPDLPYGKVICHSGWSNSTQKDYGGYRCGIADNQYDYSCRSFCGISSTDPKRSIVDGGDSGGPVWQPLPNGQIRLLGFMSNAVGSYPYQHAFYKPIWKYTTHNWTAAQSCSYCPTGPGGTVVTGAQ